MIGIIIVALIILSFCFSYKQLTKPPKTDSDAACDMISFNKSIYTETHDFKVINSDEFRDRDIKFYDKTERIFRENGCRVLGDIEDLTLSKATPDMRTFLRIMTNNEGDYSVGIYDGTPRGYLLFVSFVFGMLPLKCIDVESEFEDGHFVITTNSPKLPTLPPKSTFKQNVSRKISVKEMIDIHMNEVSAYLIKTNTRTMRFYSLEDVIESQKRQNKIYHEYRADLGYDLSKSERERFEKGLLAVIAKWNKWVQMQELRNADIPQVDPVRFGDPIALQTEWKPVKWGRAKIAAYKLIKVNPNRVEIKSTVDSIISSSVPIFIGIGFMIYLIAIAHRFLLTPGVMFSLLLAVITSSIGGYFVYSKMFPFVFDKRIGYLWKKYRPQGRLMIKEEGKNHIRLGLIHALQVIAEYHRSVEGSDYYTYELNLVLKSSGRINLVGHFERDKLVRDARFLAEFLDVPVWDATKS